MDVWYVKGKAVQNSPAMGDWYSNAQRGANTQAQLDQGQGGTDKASELEGKCKDRNLPRDKGDNFHVAIIEGGEYQGREFPWRIERIVREDENWCGVWVLEMKDMWSMEREKEYQ